MQAEPDREGLVRQQPVQTPSIAEHSGRGAHSVNQVPFAERQQRPPARAGTGGVPPALALPAAGTSQGPTDRAVLKDLGHRRVVRLTGLPTPWGLGRLSTHQ